MNRTTVLAVTCSWLLLAGCNEMTGPGAAAGPESAPQFGVGSGPGAAANGATNEFVPVGFFRSSDCDGDVVEITGTVHVMVFERSDGDVLVHTNYRRVTAVGELGGNYRVVGADHLLLPAPFPLPSSVHHQGSFRLLRHGSGDDLHVNVLFHITLNANGQVTTSIDRLTSECR